MVETSRKFELMQMLLGKLAHLKADIRTKIRDIKEVGTSGEVKYLEMPEDGGSDSSVNDDVDLAIIQLNLATQTKIIEAIKRLRADKYGLCSDCGNEIPQLRLKALVFALRCRGCEEKVEAAALKRRRNGNNRPLLVSLLDDQEV